MKTRWRGSMGSAWAMLSVLLIICFGVMGQGCPPATPPVDDGGGDGGGGGDGDGGGGGGGATIGNSGVTGKYTSASPQVVVDSANDVVNLGCGFCHPTAHSEWQTTAHSTAMETLEAIGQDKNPICLPCHTVGFGEPGGFVDRATTNALAGVQCESCHGPGRDHVNNIQDVSLRPPASIAMLDANICGKCHTDAHHPTFDEWAESAHAGGEFWEEESADFVGDPPSRLASCGECHSGDYRQLRFEEGATVTDATLKNMGVTVDELHPIVCATCHDPHLATGLDGGVEPGRDFQLRYSLVANSPSSDILADATNPARFNLCGQCHHARRDTNGTATGSDTWQKTSRPPHHSPQANVINGEMPIPPGTTSIRPNQQHAHSFTERQCATCHVKFVEVDNPTDLNPVNSGHRFEVNMEACVECHKPPQNIDARQASLKSYVANTLDRIKARLDVAVPPVNGKPGWEYASNTDASVNQASLSDNVKKVRFIYYYVANDGSGGAHNPTYVKDLLTYAELVTLP